MKKDKFIYIGIIAILILVAVIGLKFSKGDSVDNKKVGNLEKYRSEDIPEECRISDYEDDVESWKQHLSHHQETLYCLDYYE